MKPNSPCDFCPLLKKCPSNKDYTCSLPNIAEQYAHSEKVTLLKEMCNNCCSADDDAPRELDCGICPVENKLKALEKEQGYQK